MGLKNLTRKVDEYNDRLSSGKAEQIKPRHVENVLEKLQAREKSLIERIEESDNPSRIGRLERKLKIARQQVKRAEWLLEQAKSDKLNDD